VSPRLANLVTALALVGLLVALALTAPRWARLMRQAVPAPPEEEAALGSSGGARTSSEEEAERTISVKLYFESPELSGLLPEDRSLPFSLDLSRQLRTVVEELVRGSTTGLISPLPSDTRVLDVFVTARGVAFVSLSKEATEGLGGGSTTELLTVYSVVNSITANFPAVKRVQLLLDDRPVVTFAGHVDVSRPLPPDMTFVAVAMASPSPGPESAPPAVLATP
jgi:Sporulation and spore germination